MPELNTVREALNELPFVRGKRQVFLGNVRKMFPGEDEAAVAGKLRLIEEELARHDLSLLRAENDLYAVQQLRRRETDMSWLGEGLRWSSRITTVALEMVLPGVAGWWLDRQFGTSFLALVGVALGLPLGIWHLIVMTRKKPS